MRRTYCSVPMCTSLSQKYPNLSFHKFPIKGTSKVLVANKLGTKDCIDRQRAWILKLKMATSPSIHMRVCSLHFTAKDFFPRSSSNSIAHRFLKRNAVPSCNLPLQNKTNDKYGERLRRRNEMKRPHSIKMDIFNSVEIKLEIDEPEECSSHFITKSETHSSTHYVKNSVANNEIKMDNLNDSDSVEIKLEQEELIIKDEPEIIAKSLCITNDLINTENSIEQNHKDEVCIIQKPSTSDFDQDTFKYKVCSRFKTLMLCHLNAEQNCDKLGKVSGQNKDVTVEQNHTDEKPFKCPNCQKYFSTNGILKTHMLIHGATKPFKCQQCNKGFTQNGNLKKHMLIHKSKKPFKCQQCGKSFLANSDLKYHSKIHEGKKSFKCLRCGKDFIYNSSLKKHMLMHEGKRPFKCEQCDKSFNQNCNLKAHTLIHEGKKPFECQQCSKRFSTNSSLKMHMLLHADKKPVKCQHCHKRFTLENYLKRHRCQ